MDQDCRRVDRRGGLNQLLLPKVRNIGKMSCFPRRFLNANRKLACRGGGWHTVFLKEYGQILTKSSPSYSSVTSESYNCMNSNFCNLRDRVMRYVSPEQGKFRYVSIGSRL